MESTKVHLKTEINTWVFRLHEDMVINHPTLSVTCSGGSRSFYLGELYSPTPMASAIARAYDGGLGAFPPVESRGKAPGQGQGGEAPWSWIVFSTWDTYFALKLWTTLVKSDRSSTKLEDRHAAAQTTQFGMRKVPPSKSCSPSTLLGGYFTLNPKMCEGFNDIRK